MNYLNMDYLNINSSRNCGFIIKEFFFYRQHTGTKNFVLKILLI
jgi:hypothetical protein